MTENISGRWDVNDHFIPGIAVTHTMAHDPTNGPPYCDECSAAWQNWVRWPCEGSKA